MPVDYTLAEFQHIIRQKMQLPKETALMFFVKNKKLLKLGCFFYFYYYFYFYYNIYLYR